MGRLGGFPTKNQRSYFSTITKVCSPHRTSVVLGGLGNVHDRMLPPSTEASNLMFRHTKRPKTVSIIGAPMTFGQPYVGTDDGPRLLREAQLFDHLTSIGWRVEDMGDLDFKTMESELAHEKYTDDSHNTRNSLIVGGGCKMVADAVIDAVSKDQFPLILGGDHSIGVGSLAGLLKARPNLGVIWVDAHADLNTPKMSESGNIHGMPVGLLMEGMYDVASIPGFEWLGSPEMKDVRLDPDSIVYIGLRDVDSLERHVLQEKNIKAFTMFDIDKYGIGKVMDYALSHLLQKDPSRPLHLSYDIDAVDPLHAPATGTAVRGGLTYREAHFVAEAAVRSGYLSSVEMVELNPTLSDEDGSTATVELGVGLLTSLMGKTII